MSGESAQTYSVRKLIASWLMIFPFLSPPSIGTNCTRDTRVWIVHIAGVGVHGDCQAVDAMGVEGWALITGRCLAVLIIGGTLPGMLFHVRCECVCFVFFNRLGAIGFGVVIMAGASVILVRGVSTLCCPICSMSPSTFCSTICSGGGMYGWHCKSPGGGSEMWVGCVSVRQCRCCSQSSDASFCFTLMRTQACFLGGSLLSVITNSLMTSCK